MAAALWSAAMPMVLAQECPPGFTRYACNETDASLVADDLDWFGGNAFTSATLTWESCAQPNDKDLECAILRVPQDYANPFNPLFIDLPLVRHPSTKTGAKSVLLNYGGPGASGIEAFVKGDGKRLKTLYGDDYHWMSFDPRGTGLTTPYRCPQVSSALSNTLTTLRGRQQLAQTSINQADTCNRETYRRAGTLLGTAYVARDVRRIFRALGEDNLIRYYGVSYGTLLGATISAMFPKEIDRMILDANVDPDSHYTGLREDRGTDTDKALLNFFNLCAAAGTAQCALARKDQTGAQLRTTFYNFVDKLRNKNFESGGAKITYYGVKRKMFTSLYGPSKWVATANEINGYYSGAKEVKKRDTSDMDKRAAFDPAAAVEADLATTAVRCSDWRWTNTGGSVSFLASAIEQWLPRFTSVSRLAGDIFVSHPVNCMSWKLKARERYAGKWANIRTKTPVLLINGIYDPVTPLAAARELSQALVGSRVLVHSGAGHGCRQNPSKFVTDSIKAYLKSGVLPDVRVTQAPTRANFFVPTGTALTSGLNDEDTIPTIDYNNDNKVDLTEEFYPAMLLAARRDAYALPHLRSRQSNSTGFNTTSLPSGCVEVPDKCPGDPGFDVPAEKSPGADEPLADETTITASPTTVTEGCTSTVYTTFLEGLCPTGLTTTPAVVTATCGIVTGGVPDGYTTTAVFCSACPTPSTVVLTTQVTGGATQPTQVGGTTSASAQTPGTTVAGGSSAGRPAATSSIVRAGANARFSGSAVMMGVVAGVVGCLVL